MKLETAAILISNKNYLSLFSDKISNYLSLTGYQVKNVSCVDENQFSVARELKILTRLFDLVIALVQGNAEIVSEALGDITSQELVNITELTGYDISKRWPAGTKLLKNHNACPVVHLRRIFVLNTTSLDQQLNSPLKNHLKQYTDDPLYSKIFYVTLNGSQKQIDELRSIVEVEITKATNHQDRVTLTSRKFENIVEGEIVLRERLKRNILNSRWINHYADLVYSSEEVNIQKSINMIENCLKTFGINNMFLSFNGGKDCTVLLHLVKTVLQNLHPDQSEKLKIFCLYVKSNNTFQEQDDFIEQCKTFYNLEVTTVTTSIKEALRATIEERPNFKVCFMGSRRTDPYCSKLNYMQMTDADWPQIMRCSPFLDWHHSDIWDYLLYYKVPYCKLYDYGYTSLGSSTNTVRNPTLVCPEKTYLPAYKMLNEKEERSGRNVSKI